MPQKNNKNKMWQFTLYHYLRMPGACATFFLLITFTLPSPVMMAQESTMQQFRLFYFISPNRRHRKLQYCKKERRKAVSHIVQLMDDRKESWTLWTS